jgi:choline dehydrogenase-like flavoprotein
MILAGDALPQDRPTEVDVAIVGAGAVGVALATRLAGRVGRIALIEAGGPRYELDQQLNFFKADEVADRRHPPTQLNRRRMLGGTTSVWGGRCIPLDPDDFIPGPGRSGWPVAFDEVAAHYPHALDFLDAGAPDFTISAALRTPSGLLSHTTDSDVLLDRIERFSKPTNVWGKWGATLAKTEQVTVLHGAACTEILASPDGNRVLGLRLVTRSNKSLKVLAPIVVLACGGLETPRLLLASRSIRSCGLGNEHDLVGRFYMTHLVGSGGHLRLASPKAGRELDYATTSDGVYVRRLMLLSPAVRRREGLFNIVFRPDIPQIGDPSHRDSILSAMYLVKRFIIAEYARRLVADGDSCGVAGWCEHVANVALGFPRLAGFGVDWMRRRTFAKRKLPSVFLVRPDGNYPLEFNAEQSPDSESRVLLGSDLCPNGIPRLAVRWRVTEGDLALICHAYQVLRTAFKSNGFGEIQLDPDMPERIRTSVVAQAGHHIGTVRMGQDARTGVVDRYGEVWETKGLFVAGAALFPTSGFANPTLSAVALAFYVAEHLLQRLRN